MSDRTAGSGAVGDEPAKNTRLYKVLCTCVHDPEARSGVPAAIRDFQDRSQVRYLESVARNHDEIVAVCERHEARLRAAAAGMTWGSA